MPGQSPEFSIILAAGKGTRMRSTSCHKVCFHVDGKPVINRALEIYNDCGIKMHIIVVGAMAGQVIDTVGKKFNNTVFTYQAQQLGTAHAVKDGLKAFYPAVDSDSNILLVAGDRIIEPSVLEQLIDLFYSENCDVALLATPSKAGSSQGRIVEDSNGIPLAIIEFADILQKTIYKKILSMAEKNKLPSPSKLMDLIREKFTYGEKIPDDIKLAKAFGQLWKKLSSAKKISSEDIFKIIKHEMTCFDFTCSDNSGISKTPEEVNDVPAFNTSVYVIKASALNYALSHLDRNNAQQEEYLSGLVSVLGNARKNGKPHFNIKMFKVENSNDVLGFNDPAELLEVEAYIQSTTKKHFEIVESKWFRQLSEWKKSFKNLIIDKISDEENLWNEFVSTYSNDKKVIKEHIKFYLALADYSEKIIGTDENVFIVRSPGRVNVMGRHIDHQGGNCNLMTIGYETLMIVHPRDDDRVFLYNMNKESFGDRNFSISELLTDLPWDDWLSLVNSTKVSDMISTYGVDWSQYIKAAVLRLQKKFTKTKLRGMDIVINGNIPTAAGLSSSSSLVVGAAEAVVAVNKLSTFPSQLIDLCGEGEWFVGTRGGSADHAAVKLGQKGKVVKVTFFDFAVKEIVPFPDDYILAVCDSGIKAVKSANAKDQFNHRISCYKIGFKMIKKFFPQFAPLLGYLRDVNMRNLGIPLSWIYRILLHLPEQTTKDEIYKLLPNEDLEQIFLTHNSSENTLYPIRGVVLFGLAEFERSRIYANYLKHNNIEEIGRLMNTSHNGDRVASFTEKWKKRTYMAPISNSYLLNLMEDLESGDPERVLPAQLQWQPGSYHCSIPAIDKMVDVSLKVKGVAGAQLAGAGLGGCMMVLTHKESVQELIENLKTHYYNPANATPTILLCKPVAGSGILAG